MNFMNGLKHKFFEHPFWWSGLILSTASLMYGFYKNWTVLIAVGAVTTVCSVGYRLINRRRELRILEESMRDSTEIDSMSRLFGDQGIKEHLNVLKGYIENGNDIERGLVLELLKGVQFEEKDSFFIKAFEKGALEIKFKVIEFVFHWHVSYQVLIDIMDQLGKNEQEYLVRSIFMNYKELIQSGCMSKIMEKAEVFKHKEEYAGDVLLMFQYLFEEKKENYNILLGNLVNSFNIENQRTAAEIMKNYIHIEDGTNRSYLRKMMTNAEGNLQLLRIMMEICPEYDENLDYLKSGFCIYYGYDFVDKVCTFYEPLKVIKALKNDKTPLARAYVLHAVSFLDSMVMQQYFSIAEEILNYLLRLEKEIIKIRRAGGREEDLLLYEVIHFKNTLITVLFDYLTAYSFQQKVKDLAEAIKTPQDIIELLKVTIAPAFVEKLEVMVIGEIEIENMNYDYSVLSVNDAMGFLEGLYRNFGGDSLNTQISESIEKMVVLKSIPMFSNLDVITLYELLKITKYTKFSKGETIIREGDKGDSFFVIIEGNAGVYKGEKSIATIGKGGIVGELAVIDEQERTATVKALEETLLLIFKGSDFIQLLHENSSISFSVIQTLTYRLRDLLSKQKNKM